MKTSSRKFTPVSWLLLALAIAGLSVGLWPHLHSAHSSAHAHEGHGAAALALNNGARWETDQPLRIGLQRIRDAVQSAADAQAKARLTAGQTAQLAATIQENVNHLIANCKLPPQADATLHVFITDLLSGAGMLKEDPASSQGLSLLVEALRKYPEYFNHPEWKPLTAPSSS